MKILLLNHEYTLTGSTLLLLRLAEHLRRSGHGIGVSAALPASGPIEQLYRQHGFAVLEPSAATDFDLAICNTIMTAPQLIDLSARMKTIWWIHEGSVGLEHLLREPARREAFARANVVIFPIEHLRDTIYRSFIYALEPSRFVVIPYGIPPIAASQERAAGGEFRVVSVGSVYPRKRHEDLIRAMTLYPDLSARCVIAGPFYTLPEDCMQIINADPDRFELTGELEHEAVIELLASADVFCLPSSSEVMPVTTFEAAMLEKPMVLSDLSVYEGFWRHGHNCLLHPVGAIGMLAQSIAMLATNPELRLRLAAAARRTAAPFTEAAFCARFDAVLNGL